MKPLGKRMRFLRWLRNDVFKVAVGTVAPKPLQIIYNILFPILSAYNKQNDLRYDAERNVYFVNEIEFDGEFFEIIKNAANDGVKFQLSFSDGIVKIRRIDQVQAVVDGKSLYKSINKRGRNGDN